MFSQILIVCTGNICRSPMAEALLARKLSAYSQINVTSAGISALVGYPADETAQTLLLEQRIDISTHRARQLTSLMLRQVDLVLVMETGQKRAIDTIDPSARGKVYRLGEWGGFDIPDPYRRPRAAFEGALQLIQQGVTDWSAKLIL
ncbi:MAG: low molecular weight protein-tyrosine-phosphatase [Candidatus Competibacteraceae bacterium]